MHAIQSQVDMRMIASFEQETIETIIVISIKILHRVGRDNLRTNFGQSQYPSYQMLLNLTAFYKRIVKTQTQLSFHAIMTQQDT